jgi:hypothetical protein
VLRFCEQRRPGHYVPDHDAQLLRIETSGSTAGRRVYACHEDIRDKGLLPVPAGSVPREDA